MNPQLVEQRWHFVPAVDLLSLPKVVVHRLVDSGGRWLWGHRRSLVGKHCPELAMVIVTIAGGSTTVAEEEYHPTAVPVQAHVAPGYLHLSGRLVVMYSGLRLALDYSQAVCLNLPAMHEHALLTLYEEGGQEMMATFDSPLQMPRSPGTLPPKCP
jgi:hypothetical protein